MSQPQRLSHSCRVGAGLASILWIAGMGQAAALSAPFTISNYSGGGSYGTVNVTQSGMKVAFSVEAPAGSQLKRFGFNSDVELRRWHFQGLNGWTLKKNKNMDGFGKFDYVLRGPRTSTLDFKIRWIPGDTPEDYFSGNSNNYFYSAYLRPAGETGILHFVAAVPELETWAMIGAGMGLLGWYARRRNQRLANPAAVTA